MKVGAVIQARMGATRLPGKVLKPLPWGSSRTVLDQVVRRLERCRNLDEVILATTDSPEDEPLLRMAPLSYAGSQHDVLDRYYRASQGLDVIVRITADCPCLDPEVVDRCVAEHLDTGADFTTNALPRSFPHGLDTEVMSFAALERAHQKATEPGDREHVILYLEQNRDGLTRIHNVVALPEQYAPDLRLTLDTPEDYALLGAVFDLLPEDFGVEEVIGLFVDRPWLRELNARVRQKQSFASFEEELDRARELLILHEMHRAAALLEP